MVKQSAYAANDDYNYTCFIFKIRDYFTSI